MQEIKFVTRNFSTTLKSFKEHDSYETIPEKLIDFQQRINHYLAEGYRYVSHYTEQVNNATIPVIILVRDA